MLYLFTVVEVESVLRHKAKLGREQCLAERAVYSNVLLPPLLVTLKLNNFHSYGRSYVS
jgi:hypothetical protein